MTRGTLEIPLDLFLEQPQLGQEFMCQLQVRVVKLEEEQVDVTSYEDELVHTLPAGSCVTMNVISFVRARIEE